MPTPRSSRLSSITVTCHQCGGADMTRLDRKEYRCNHCGAITVISDDDADRLEQVLASALSRPTAAVSGPLSKANRIGGIIGLVIVSIFVLFGIVGSLIGPRHRHSSYSSSSRSDSTVPLAQVNLSPLQWAPDSGTGGAYTGLLYNHSGSTIEAPDYSMTLFRNGMKQGTAIYSGMLRTLQPGEYEYVKFRVLDDKPDRYEIGAPNSISQSSPDAIAPAQLSNAQFAHQKGSRDYLLVGIVQNTFTRPIRGVGQLLLYDKDQQIIGAGEDTFTEIRPGEKVFVSMDAWTQAADTPVAAYEYIIDAQYTDSR